MSGDYAALVGRVQQALADLERVVSRAESLMDKAQHSGDDGYLDGVALNLHGFYVGIERIFEDIAREVEASVPSGVAQIGIRICCSRCRLRSLLSVPRSSLRRHVSVWETTGPFATWCATFMPQLAGCPPERTDW